MVTSLVLFSVRPTTFELPDGKTARLAPGTNEVIVVCDGTSNHGNAAASSGPPSSVPEVAEIIEVQAEAQQEVSLLKLRLRETQRAALAPSTCRSDLKSIFSSVLGF